jgi:hypothetical protein
MYYFDDEIDKMNKPKQFKSLPKVNSAYSYLKLSTQDKS